MTLGSKQFKIKQKFLKKGKSYRNNSKKIGKSLFSSIESFSKNTKKFEDKLTKGNVFLTNSLYFPVWKVEKMFNLRSRENGCLILLFFLHFALKIPFLNKKSRQKHDKEYFRKARRNFEARSPPRLASRADKANLYMSLTGFFLFFILKAFIFSNPTYIL